MKSKIVMMLFFGLVVFTGLGLLTSCEEEKAVNTSPTACLKIVSFQQSSGLKLLKAGQSYTFTREIKNDGPSDAKEVTLGYYLSTDEKITSSDIPLNVEDKLDLPSETNNVKNLAIAIPSSAAPGTKYYIGVLVTSSSCTNNCPDYKSCELTIADTPTANSSCLSIVKWQKLLFPNDYAVSGDENVLFLGEIKNDGSVLCSNVQIKFYLSIDNTITTEDTYLDTYQDTLEIPIGKTETINPNLHIPNNLNKQEHYYIGLVITSSSCENACSPSAAYEVVYEPYPYRISIWAKSNLSQRLFRGDTVMFRREIQNIGTTACSNVRIGYYLSTDADITTGDIYVGEETINLPVHDINTGQIELTIPFSLPAQCYYIGILIVSSSCSNDAAPSSSFSQCLNDSPLWGTIDYGSGSTQPTDVTCGNSYTFRRTIKNYASRDCDATLRYYLSTDCTFTASDTYLDVEETITVAANSQNVGTINLPIPKGLSPDVYHISALITSTQCINPQPPVGWDIAVTCPSLSDPIGRVSPDKKLKASCH